MNYAALLGVLAAVTFTLPLLARLAEQLGLHRSTGVAASLVVAALAAAIWYVKASRAKPRRSRSLPARGARLEVGPAAGPPEEDDASLQGHR